MADWTKNNWATNDWTQNKWQSYGKNAGKEFATKWSEAGLAYAEKWKGLADKWMPKWAGEAGSKQSIIEDATEGFFVHKNNLRKDVLRIFDETFGPNHGLYFNKNRLAQDFSKRSFDGWTSEQLFIYRNFVENVMSIGSKLVIKLMGIGITRFQAPHHLHGPEAQHEVSTGKYSFYVQDGVEYGFVGLQNEKGLAMLKPEDDRGPAILGSVMTGFWHEVAHGIAQRVYGNPFQMAEELWVESGGTKVPNWAETPEILNIYITNQHFAVGFENVARVIKGLPPRDGTFHGDYAFTVRGGQTETGRIVPFHVMVGQGAEGAAQLDLSKVYSPFNK